MTSSSGCLAFVTALYPIREGYAPQLLTEFQRLLAALPPTAPVIVFTDVDIPASPRLHVIRTPLLAFQTYANMMAAASSAAASSRLPAHRNPAKDTLAFLALMNTKTEMVWTADSLLRRGVFQGFSEVPTHLAWIDCGIHKIFRPTDDVAGALGRIVGSPLPTNKILMPGCWGPQADVSADAVNWRFCGGFFVVPRSLAARFYHATEWTRVSQFADTPTWEVNVWAAMEKWEGELLAWWSADHNIRMLEIPTSLQVSALP